MNADVREHEAIPYMPVDRGAQSVEEQDLGLGRIWTGWAIKLPNGTYWHEPVTDAREVATDGPALYRTEAEATRMRNNIQRAVIDTYGPASYSPTVVPFVMSETKGAQA
ncbi:hypothetical protein A5789_22005 [Nocardia sp. 852002-51101_SCH5132738]|uniref:hypothetical protein n=1 Tax=Nocardia sp. 852002-51101_SCH5132738 TaxID=1834095 RepID=UPI0007EAA6E8|nr:hypothetical protein [Nocardia sp. 852002-51101_SCH5132738]OBA54436.1 hypothetical protein A5789_22005 [Nocardia sp. 852002-51101_SCH5132738]